MSTASQYLHRVCLTLAVAIGLPEMLSAAPPVAEPANTTPAASATPTQEELFKQFEEKLSGAQLVGYFTESGKESDNPLKADKYTIEKVKKLKDDFWLFEARIQYDGKDTKVPMPLEVKWAGDTPVVTLTKVFVPGLGTFTARVLFYGDEYAGTWSAADHGGHMFGKIVRPDAESTDDKPTDPSPPAAAN
ncbi:MAG: hypothetical protein K1X71_15500 [Pirellulales bacterium]|nr:hypothetical protein [Pirellulales bacterium]